MSAHVTLPLSALRLRCGLHQIKSEPVLKLVALMQQNVALPPLRVTATEDGVSYWIEDGCHRFVAAKHLNMERIPCVIQ